MGFIQFATPHFETKLQICIRMGIIMFKIFIWGGLSSDIRSEITFYVKRKPPTVYPTIYMYLPKWKFWIQLSPKFHPYFIYLIIFTFPLRVFKWTSTFEMWFIPSWTNRFKPYPHTRHLSGLTFSTSNNVASLLTFAWRWTRVAMTLSAEIWRFGCSKPYVMSDLIQNIWKPSQVRWKLKIDTWLII